MAGLWAAASDAAGRASAAAGRVGDFVASASAPVRNFHRNWGEFVDQNLDHHWRRWGEPLARHYAAGQAGEFIGRVVHNSGMVGGPLFHLPGSVAMYRAFKSRAYNATYRALNPRVRTPFVRYPRMFVRPVPHWQTRFGGSDSGSRRRTLSRRQFYEARDAWKQGFRDF